MLGVVQVEAVALPEALLEALLEAVELGALPGAQVQHRRLDQDQDLNLCHRWIHPSRSTVTLRLTMSHLNPSPSPCLHVVPARGTQPLMASHPHPPRPMAVVVVASHDRKAPTSRAAGGAGGGMPWNLRPGESCHSKIFVYDALAPRRLSPVRCSMHAMCSSTTAKLSNPTLSSCPRPEKPTNNSRCLQGAASPTKRPIPVGLLPGRAKSHR